MPKLYSRTEVHFPPDLNRKLEIFQRRLSEHLEKRVSKSSLIRKIVENFFETSKVAEEMLQSNPDGVEEAHTHERAQSLSNQGEK